MKNQILNTLLALTAVFSLNTFATSLAPAAPLIEVTVGGGMPVPNGTAVRKVTVNFYGQVLVQISTYGDLSSPDWSKTTQKFYSLPSITASDLQLIKDTVDTLKGGALVKFKGPGCMDAPSSTYSIYKNGEEIKVHQRFNCRELPLRDRKQRPAADSIRNFLDQLLQLTYKH